MIFKPFEKKLQIISVGGQGEIGRNMTVLRYGNNIVIIDCGIKFPDESMLGIDLVIPDMSYLIKNKSIIRGLIITHGHEDHIGAVPYLLKNAGATPIYGSKLALGLIENKLKEHRLTKQAKFHFVEPKEIINIGPFKIEFVRVCHSIPDAFALFIKTPVGSMFHTGDFKIDYTPIDSQSIDLDRIRGIGDEGVSLMMSDSTNADIEGSTPSERLVGENLNQFFSSSGGRIIIALFASNIHRAQQIIDAATNFKRKIAVSGLSMQKVIDKAKELGYLSFHKDIFIKLDDISKYPDKDIIILTTGSQGEPMSALTRMAAKEHKQVQIRKGDTIIISAIPIPGNEKSVSRSIDNLLKLGADVIYEERHGLHVSGHACQDDMKLMLELIRPKYFIPVHGEYRHLIAHAKIAEGLGIEKQNIFICENGDMSELSNSRFVRKGKIEIKDIFVDGTGVGDISSQILNERGQLAENGMIAVYFTVLKSNLKLVSDIRFETRGFVFASEPKDLANDAMKLVRNIIEKCQHVRHQRDEQLRQDIRKELGKFIMKKTDRRPMIIPIIIMSKNG